MTSPSAIVAPWQNRVCVSQRLVAVALWLGCTALLAVAASLEPNAAGYGTHENLLGMKPCSFIAATGLPCATCGMTTSFSLAAHGQIFKSLANQPAGGVGVIAVAMLWIISFYAMLTGMKITPLVRWFGSASALLLLAGLVLASWVYKIGLVKGMF